MATADDNAPFFSLTGRSGLGAYTPDDDSLHQEMNDRISDPALTETQYLGFNVPEASIHALNYLWLHPNLRMMSGGVWAWQGMKPNHLTSELFDMRYFMSDAPIRQGGLTNYELPMGYRVKVTEPLEKIHIAYEDSKRDNGFDVTYTAIMPPAMLASGRHFDQAMRTEGEILLRGRRHRVDGYTVRDRSWGEVRSEEPRPMPPLHWLTGVFDDNFAFHLCALEDPSKRPIWESLYPDADAMTGQINRGWIWRDSELAALASTSLTTEWDVATGLPVSHRLQIADTMGREVLISGALTATCTWSFWANSYTAVSLTRWECDGRVGWGDNQTIYWTDFAHHCR